MKNVSDIYALSPIQELMLVHALARPDTDLLFNQIVYGLEGDLDGEVYQSCWNDLVQRHPMLRTMFLWEGLKAPVQVVRERVELEWQNHDWSERTSEEQETLLAELLQNDQQRGFRLNQAPMMRFALCRRSETNYALVWSSHHLILDRWCIGILMNEAAALYRSKISGSAPPFDSRRPFRDYIRWLQQQDSRAAENFWRSELAGITQPTPIDTGTATGKEASYGDQKVLINVETSMSLRRFAGEHHLTLGTLVMGAWALLHAVRNPSGDVLLGVTVSGRPPLLPGVEGMIGPFINNVPVRVGLPPDQTLVNWLQKLQDRQQEIQGYAYISPLQIQEWSDMPGAGALFETLFLYQSPVKMPAALQMVVEKATLQTNFPLTLAVEEGPHGLLLLMIYAQSRYGDGDIARLLQAMEKALNGILAHPEYSPTQLIEELRTVLPAGDPKAQETARFEITTAGQPPRNGFEARLFNLWANVLDHQNFGIDDNFFDLGASSFQAVQLLSQMRKTFEQEISVAALFAAPTIAQMAEVLSSGKAAQPWSSLVPIKPSGRKAPIFLVHHGGGGITGYAKLASALDPDRPLYGLQEPGIENGQSLPTSVIEIARLYVQEIQSIQPHGPYYLGGFCFGGVVAFEMAQQLREQGEEVDLLILLDAIRPGTTQANQLEDRLAVHRARMAGRSTLGKGAYIVYRIGRRVRREAERGYMAARQVVELLAFDLFERFRRPVPSYLRQRRLLELNGHLNDDYVPKPYAGRTLLIRGTYPELRYELDFGWNTVVLPEVTTCLMDTEDHLQMMIQPKNLEVLVGYLQEALKED